MSFDISHLLHFIWKADMSRNFVEKIAI